MSQDNESKSPLHKGFTSFYFIIIYEGYLQLELKGNYSLRDEYSWNTQKDPQKPIHLKVLLIYSYLRFVQIIIVKIKLLSYLQFNRKSNNYSVSMIGTVTKTVLKNTELSYAKLSNKIIFNTAFAQKKFKKRKQMKPYQILLTSLPNSQINISALIHSSQLRNGLASKLLFKASRTPQLVTNSTEIQIQSLYFLRSTKSFQKGFALLVQNILKIMSMPEKLQKCGIFKPSLMQKLLYIIKRCDSLYAESCIHMLSIFVIDVIEKSNSNYRIFNQEKIQIDLRLEALEPLLNDDNLSQDQKSEVFSEYQTQKQLLVQLEWKYPFLQQQDLIDAINFALQKGYYNSQIITQAQKLIKIQYDFEVAKQIIQKRQNQGKNAYICCLFKLISRKLKLLNSFKSYKLSIIKTQKLQQQEKQQKLKQTSQNKNFLKKKQEKNIDKNDSKIYYLNKIEQQVQALVIEKKQYKKLVKLYIQLLQNPDYLCYLLDDKTVKLAENLQTDFYQYITHKYPNDQRKDDDRGIQLSNIKRAYMKFFYKIFDIQKNGGVYAGNNNVYETFQIVLKMFDHQDRHEVVQLLKLFQHFSLMNSFGEILSYSIFYVCQKYKYRSNFLASKYINIIFRKYGSQRQHISLKQEMIFNGVQMCKNLSLYFELLQSRQKDTLSSPIQKYNKQINQAIQTFFNQYNKLTSVLYFQDEKLGFIDKCVQMKSQIMKKKRFLKTSVEDDISVSQEVNRLLRQSQKIIKGYQKNAKIKNFYFDILKIYDQNDKKEIKQQAPSQQQINQGQKNKKWRDRDRKIQNDSPQYQFFDYKTQSYLIKHETNLQVLAQISTIMDIVLTALKLQKKRQLLSMQDTNLIIKGVLANEKNRKIILQNIAYPKLLKKLYQIGNHFKTQNNQNTLWKQIYKKTKFNTNNFIRDQRINFAKEGKQIFFLQEEIALKTEFQQHLTALAITPITLKNPKLQKAKDYEGTQINIINNLRSDVIYSAQKIYGSLKKLAKDQLMELSKKSAKAIKFQANYLEYPYLADIAISKSNSITILLIRGKDYLIKDIQKTADKAVEQYLDQCQKYYRQGKMTVIVVTNIAQLKQVVQNLTKNSKQ